MIRDGTVRALRIPRDRSANQSNPLFIRVGVPMLLEDR
jgi:hypothetical protein